MMVNDLGKKNLVESCACIKITDFLRQYKRQFNNLMLSAGIELLGIEITLTTSKTGNGGIRVWFTCPICETRVGIIYKHPLNYSIGCRKCLNLEYRKRRYKGMLESEI